MRIGMIAPPWVPVPPLDYGGTEVVIDQLARGLADHGHDVVLFTTGDATCPVPRLWHHQHSLGTTAPMTGELFHVEAAYEALPHCDVIHDHTLIGPFIADQTHHRGTPIVTTAHGPFTPELREHFRMVARRAAIISISANQRAHIPDVPATVIHHGVDVTTTPVGDGRGGFALFVGRMSPDKGVHIAIDAAREAGIPLRIAAKMWEPDEIEYFDGVVKPMLGPDVTYLGSVNKAQRDRLMGQAWVVLNPIRWPEPFGLVMIEALATGTPVVALSHGAAPEIIEHGETGYLVNNEAELAEYLRAALELDRTRCREAALTRFSTDRMVADHLAVYRRQRADPRSPVADRPIVLPDTPPLVRR